MKNLLIGLFLALILSCSSGERARYLDTFPVDFRIAEVDSGAMETYFYTDTIIYITENNFVDSIQSVRDATFNSDFFNGVPTPENFRISSLSFTSPTEVTATIMGSPSQLNYTEQGGLGIINLASSSGLGFRVDPEVTQLVSCYTLINERSIDTLYEDSFLPGLDTLYDMDSIFAFQLLIQDESMVTIQSCNPFEIQGALRQYGLENGLQNDDRILVYRRNLIYTKI